MRRLIFGLVILSLALIGCATSCNVNWKTVDRELGLTVKDVDDLKILMQDDPDIYPILEKLSVALKAVQTGVNNYVGGAGDLITVADGIDLALAITDELVSNLSGDEEKIRRVKAGIMLARAVLRRVKSYTLQE